MNEEDKINIEEAIKRCKELTKEKHSCWIGITNQEAIETVLAKLEKKEIQTNRLTTLSLKLNEQIENLKLIAGLSLKRGPIEISKKTFYEFHNTIEIEKIENVENDSFIFRAI